jgi:hypothetical protein
VSLSIAVVAILSTGRPVAAAPASPPSQQDRAGETKARDLYVASRYEQALEIYTALSKKYPEHPIFLRHVGACYYKLRLAEPAIANLEAYLKSLKPKAAAKDTDALRWIEEMKAILTPSVASSPERTSPSGVTQAGPMSESAPTRENSQPALSVQALPDPAEGISSDGPSSGSAPHPAPPVARAPEAALTTQAPTSPPMPAVQASNSVAELGGTPAGRTLKIAGILCAAAGMASVGTAVYFYSRTSFLSDRISTSENPSASDYKSAKSAVTMQWVFYSAGAAMLATGSALYYLGWRANVHGQTTVAPVFSPGLAGLSVKGGF